MLPLGRFLSIKKIYLYFNVCVCFIHTHDIQCNGMQKEINQLSLELCREVWFYKRGYKKACIPASLCSHFIYGPGFYF